MLSGLAQLSVATKNATALAVAQRIATATSTLLTTPGGILKEPCPNNKCDGDQHIFKGIFMRHATYMAQAGGEAGREFAAPFAVKVRLADIRLAHHLPWR